MGIGEFAELTPEAKFQKALELSQQGLNRTLIATALYKTANEKNRLDSLNKMIKKRGYIWDKELNTYVQRSLEEVKTKSVENKSTNKNKQELLIAEELKALRELRMELQATLEQIKGQNDEEVRDFTESVYSSFEGLLQGTTIQLYQSVWDLLDSFVRVRKTTKKAVVNQAIFEFIMSFGGVGVVKDKDNICRQKREG